LGSVQLCTLHESAFCRFDRLNSQTRINFYTTVFLAAAIPRKEYTRELLDELYINAAFFALALLITVLVETIKGQLDLYHAIFVIHMLACFLSAQFYGMNYVPMRTSRVLIRDENTGLNRVLSAKTRIDFKLRVAYFVQLFYGIFIMPPWLLYVWIKDSRFGSQPECNHLVKYVLVFVSVRATVNWLRIFFIVLYSVNLYHSLTNLRPTYYLLRKQFADSNEGSESGLTHRTLFARVPWPLRVMWVHSWLPSQYDNTNSPHQSCSLWYYER
jgi:hypothetical protein